MKIRALPAEIKSPSLAFLVTFLRRSVATFMLKAQSIHKLTIRLDKTGLESGQVGALGQQQKQQGLDPNSLSNFLGGEQQKAQQANPDIMSTLNSLLDTDKDGSAMNDVLGMVGKMLGGR